MTSAELPRLGLVVPHRGPDAVSNVRVVPKEAEALGFHSVSFTDHIIGVRSFSPVYPPEWVEPLTSMAYVAASTSRVRIQIGVLVAPYRDPVMAAKALATIDGLSDGRLDVGIGTGWSRSEFHALGRGDVFEDRGRLTNESLDVMLRCWEGGEFGWDGEWVKFRRMTFSPRPVQDPHPPLWIGGHTGRALRRAATYADIWHPSNASPEEVQELGDKLDETAGRQVVRSVRVRVDPSDSVDEFCERLIRYREVGCVEVIIEVHSDNGSVVLGWADRLAGAAGLAL